MGSRFREERRVHSQKGLPVGFWVLIALGMIFLLSCSGCGSDTTPKTTVSGKKEMAGKGGSSAQTVTPLTFPKGGGTAAPGGGIAPTYDDKILGGVSREVVEANREAGKWEKLDPKVILLPGLTKEQLEAKLEAERAKKPNPNLVIFPGLTQGQLEATLRAKREQAVTSAEIFPGLTAEQLKAKAEQARQMQEMNNIRPEQAIRQ
jgi:hypothetical protein